jgi:hypothetical protein
MAGERSCFALEANAREAAAHGWGSFCCGWGTEAEGGNFGEMVAGRGGERGRPFRGEDARGGEGLC